MRRHPVLPWLVITVDTKVMVSEGETELERAHGEVRRHLALYIGGTGARGKNFRTHLFGRFRFVEETQSVQDLPVQAEGGG
jgi:hypothetical protein